MIGEQIAKNLIEKYNPKHVLFCPYKEEMWDSMQTIYEAFMKTDIHTDVMPIAYYSLNNGKIFDVHIEFPIHSSSFPMLLKRNILNRPDSVWDLIIYHYPYDNLNNVTRPLLYSNELKAFCKHLVLVGYACVGGRLPTMQEVSYSGVRNSDLIIYETQDQAKEAEKLLKGKPGWGGECVGWGSAKYDMIECAEIPEEWKKKAKGKRVVLLQSSIVPFLQNRQKLNQIETVIRSYIKNDKVCLIWRPHPLYKDTIIAHDRKELRHFEELEELVKNSSKDIFDETKIPEIPIKFADEMISDPSSLVILWKTTGKKLTMLE